MPKTSKSVTLSRWSRVPDFINQFKDHTVVLTGLGMLGQQIALGLATNRFGRFHLIDNDRLADSDFGKTGFEEKEIDSQALKVDAVEAQLKRKDASIQVKRYPMLFCETPKGIFLDMKLKNRKMINVVAVDNRFSLTQVISFFSTLGIHSYAGGLTPLTYQSQIYSINPYKGGCPACQFTASDFAIINTHAHCSGDSSPEEGVISIFCVAQSCAGKLISFINRDFHTNFDKKSGHKGSYKTIDSPETCLRLDINRNPECASHFPPFDDVLNASGLWTLQDLFNHVSDRMGEPVKTVELGFEWQARDADNEFINKYYCMNCHKNFFLPRLRKRVCPYCKNTRHKIITIPFSNKPTLSMNDLQPYILESVTLDCLDIRANDVFRASGLKKSIFVRNGGNI